VIGMTPARLSLLRHVAAGQVRLHRSFSGGASRVVVDHGEGVVRRYRTVTAVAKTLIEGGLITVAADGNHRWSSPIELTDRGAEVVLGA